jgi:hypothetical protein
MNAKIVSRYDLRPLDPVTQERNPEGVEPSSCDRCASRHYIVVEMMVDGRLLTVGTTCAQKLLGRKAFSSALRKAENRKSFAPHVLRMYREAKARVTCFQKVDVTPGGLRWLVYVGSSAVYRTRTGETNPVAAYARWSVQSQIRSVR